MAVYKIENVTKFYVGKAQPANDSLSFEIEAGEFFGLLGDNGAGKTTLVKQMAGLLRPDRGTVQLFGQRLDGRQMVAPHKVAYMPQSDLALNNLTVGETLYFTAHLRGLSRADARAERDRLIDLLGLGEARNRVVRQISGGQARLVLLGTTLATNRPVMILDEPTNDLSPQNRRLVWDILREQNQRHGTTVILVTHNALEAERVIERVGIMAHGKMIAIGRPGQLKGSLNSQLRLEIVFDPAYPPTLPNDARPTVMGQGRWQMLIPYHEAATYLDRINGTSSVDDFTLRTATLEDLYLSITANDSAATTEER